MPPISPSAFRRRLRRLDAEGFARFVADLYVARGWSVDREGDRLRLWKGDRTRTVVLHHEPRFRRRTIEARGTDAVVTNSRRAADRPAEARVIGPDDLREMALYAIDRSRADALLREHLGRPAVEPETRPSVPEPLSDSRTVYVAVAVVGVLALAAGLGAGVLGSGVVGVPEGSGVETTTTVTAPGAPGGFTPVPVGSTLTATPEASSRDYPEGIAPKGITDPHAIAETHARSVANRSYRLWLSRREYRGDALVAERTEYMVVESPTRYRSRVNTSGRPSGGYLVAESSMFANGTVIYTRTREDGAVSYDRRSVEITRRFNPDFDEETDRHTAGFRVERALRWGLTVSESAVLAVYTQNESDVYRYWVFGEDDPYPGVTNSTTDVIIDETGIVHRYRRSYVRPGTDRTVVLRFRYRFGNVTVEPPDWYGAARNATRRESDERAA